MAKKKTKHVNKISPAVSVAGDVDFGELKVGECFLMNGGLYMHESSDSNRDSDQCAINLATGVFREGLCGITITPVTIVITWKKK